jgi:hypothetical protein
MEQLFVMGTVKLLIAIPTKSSQLYQDRMVACQNTWLSGVPHDGTQTNSQVFWHAFSDLELGLDPNDEQVRIKRTQLMCQYALDHGYDYIFRTDSDAYVWVNRLLACEFEQYDYMGWCVDYPKHIEIGTQGLRTAHGGIGFFLSHKAMQVVVSSTPFKHSDGIYWGDIGAGQMLYKAGIYCHRDTRFMDGSGTPMHHGNVFAHELPADHPYISVHPVPAENMYGIHECFADLPAETTPPQRQIWWTTLRIDYGAKRPDICPCEYCR